jgi:hypothetical protein
MNGKVVAASRASGLGQTAAGPAGEEAAPRAARDVYLDDQLRHAKVLADHAAALKARAPARIKVATAAVKAAGLNHDAGDDPLVHARAVELFLTSKSFYPPHDRGAESAEHARVCRRLTVELDHPCMVCGVRHTTLADVAQNPFGAVRVETHHHLIEWALAEAVSPELFNTQLRPGLLRRAQGRPADLDPVFREFDAFYARDMSAKQIRAWIDHGADNLWPLCDVHHRHRFVGIHAITYPTWGPQDLVDATRVRELHAARADLHQVQPPTSAGS